MVLNALPVGGLYAITPTDLRGPELLEAARQALSGGAAMLQYRAKPPRLADAQALFALCAQFGVPLIINDDLELAHRLGCGVHLGESDGPVATARALLGPQAIIGASCYDSFALAEQAAAMGASYVAFGAFFATQTKLQPRRAELALLRQAQSLPLPCVAIGGVTLANAPSLIAAGADFVAVVQGVFAQPDVQACAQAIAELFASIDRGPVVDSEDPDAPDAVHPEAAHPDARRIRSFVLRQGRLTQGQARAMRELLPQFGISGRDSRGALQAERAALDWSALFGRQAPVVLEIGIGNGDALALCAKADPARSYLGAEVHAPGIGHGLLAIAANQLSNARVFHGDAVQLLSELTPDFSLAQVHIWFPDPWHKARHHKRRLIQPDFVALLARKLAPGGLLHLATDWQAYAAHMLAVLQAAPSWQNVQVSGGYCPEKPAWRPHTHFERRGERLGHGVWDLLFRTGISS